MMTKPTPKHLEAFNLIWPDAIRAAKAHLNDYYTPASGITTEKLKRVKVEEHTKLHLLSEVLWHLSGDVYTPHYWYMQIIEEVNNHD